MFSPEEALIPVRQLPGKTLATVQLGEKIRVIRILASNTL